MTALLAALLLAAPAAPTPAQATDLARKVQAYYEATRDLQARFEQTYTYSGFGRRQVSSGTLRVKKPGMMRWDYEAPTPKTVAVTGSRSPSTARARSCSGPRRPIRAWSPSPSPSAPTARWRRRGSSTARAT